MFFSALLALALPSVVSPDGRVAVEVNPLQATYSVSYKKLPVLLESRFGLSLYSGRWSLVGTTQRSHASEWRPVYGERSSIPDRYNELAVELRDAAPPNRTLRMVFRAYDEGIAFRYGIGGKGSFIYMSEQSEFHFPDGATGWEEHGTEGEYSRVPVGQIKPGCERPLTVAYSHGLYTSIAGAAASDYPRTLLSPSRGRPNTLITDLAGPVSGTAPYDTPWQVVVIGERPGDLLEKNYLILNLNSPLRLNDTSWIKPGKVIREVTLSTKGGKEAVDFAVARGLQYIEYDAGWYGHEYDNASDATRVAPDPDRIKNIPDHGGLDLEEVIRYARERNIGVLLYVNRRALERQLDNILPMYARMGVKGVKYGFVNVGPQVWSQWLHRAIAKAAEHRLMVDVHDSYRPSGFARTYPNLMTQEGIRGNEHMPDAGHNTTLPFTRYIAGAGDYTICYFTDRLKTTRAHQLALSVVYYSPLQFMFWYDRPSAYRGEPEVDFFSHVPTVWDDTIVLSGEIGEHAVVARRSGSAWFVGAITNTQARTIQISLKFLPAGVTYEAAVHSDGVGKHDVRISRRSVDANSVIDVALAPSGGAAIHLASAVKH